MINIMLMITGLISLGVFVVTEFFGSFSIVWPIVSVQLGALLFLIGFFGRLSDRAGRYIAYDSDTKLKQDVARVRFVEDMKFWSGK